MAIAIDVNKEQKKNTLTCSLISLKYWFVILDDYV